MAKTWIRLFACLLSVVLLFTVACGCRSGEENSAGDNSSDVTDSTGEPDGPNNSGDSATTDTTGENTTIGGTVGTEATKPSGGGSVGTTKPSTGSGIADLVSNGSKDIPSQTYAYVKNPGVGIAMEKKADSITLRAGGQKVTFAKNGKGEYILTTYVVKGGKWVAFFDGAEALIQGDKFDGHPTGYTVVADTANYKAVKLTGKQSGVGCDFDILVEVFDGNPLVHFTVTNHLTNTITLAEDEPRFMLWRKGVDNNRVSINQETPTYQDASASGWSAFPASYLYTDGMASALYFDMAPMTWYSDNGIRRFRDSKVRTVAENGKTGVGLDIIGSSQGKRIAKGDMVISFYLYGEGDVAKPTKLQALDAEVEAFAYCLDNDTNKHTNYLDGTLSYEFYAKKIIEGMMAENVSFKWENKSWNGGKLFPELSVKRIVQRSGYVKNTNMHGNNAGDLSGDWNCNNNTLVPWTLIERLHPNAKQNAMIKEQATGLLAYFDDIACLYRSFPGAYFGQGKEFTFQNYFMNQGPLWVSDFLPADSFNPALGGKFLQAADTMIQLAHNVGYVMPQLIDVARLGVAESIDEPHLGGTREVWSGGFYAYNMMLAYRVSGEQKYLNEAKTMLTKLFDGKLSFYVNSKKEKLYTDPYEFPVNEVSSAPWGIAAAQWIYRITGDKTYLTYSDNLRNLTLRMMKWYESNLSSVPMDQSLGGISFFAAFPTTDTTCPWETIQSYLPMLMELKNTDVAPSQVMLKAFNLFRINSFGFSGASWDPSVITSAKHYQSSVTAYYMPEDYYSFEVQTKPGQNGANNYMSNALMYAYLMYDAYAASSNEDMMVVNTDICDDGMEMADGVCRNFTVFNPTYKSATFKIQFKDLKSGSNYTLTVQEANGKKTTKTLTGKALMAGYSVTLGAMDYLQLKVELADKAAVTNFENAKAARYDLMQAYAKLQNSYFDAGSVTSALQAKKDIYSAALKLFNEGKYTDCSKKLADAGLC
ncbi:MAG: hypothetical protein IJ518_03605 [Clostridia bacterium]|nr:hypothetical protein [Clostridia bacterium]